MAGVVAEPEILALDCDRGVAALRIVIDVDRVVPSFDYLESCEERRVEDGGGNLADAAAVHVFQLARTDDAGGLSVAARLGAGSHYPLEVIDLAGRDLHVGGVFGRDAHVVVAVGAATVLGGIARQLVLDAHSFGFCGGKLGLRGLHHDLSRSLAGLQRRSSDGLGRLLAIEGFAVCSGDHPGFVAVALESGVDGLGSHLVGDLVEERAHLLG